MPVGAPTVQRERMDMLLRDKTEAAHTLLTHGWEPWRIALVLGWSRAKIERVLAGATKPHAVGPHTTDAPYPRRSR